MTCRRATAAARPNGSEVGGSWLRSGGRDRGLRRVGPGWRQQKRARPLCACIGTGPRGVSASRSRTATPVLSRRALVFKARAAAPRVLKVMNPVYSPGSSGVPYANAKGIGYPAGFPMGYAAAAPAYSPNMYPGANPAFQTGYSPGTPYKVSCSPTSGAVPPYSSSPNPYQTAVYPVRSAYPQQSPYAQQGTFYTQPLYAAPPHVIHHTTVVQPNGMPATVYPAPIPAPRGNGVTMGMVAGTTMAMSAGTLLTAHSPTPVAPHPVTVPTYRGPGTPTYSYVPPQW
ncbi:myelin-associated neurite-outgrowth inhibitor isoform X1 [Saccopteryx bilineata]|uniref:myelin-associated neurite-outgrowth inhibitor isoform X1 n=2 Tax=Saccopteryx bilineata TaxID=59482 RepID=UPI00338F1633